MIILKGVENMLPNPYTPGAGLVPSYLAGRNGTISEAKEIILSIAHGIPTRSVIYYGLRGVGKTVLLNKIEEIADNYGILFEHIEVSETSSFKTAISFYIQKLIRQMSTKEQAKAFLNKTFSILKAFQITYSPADGEISFGLKDEVSAAVGISDTGNFQNDLTELFVAMGILAQKNENAVCLFIDEIQNLKKDELEALIAAIHRVNQKGLPITMLGAGLSQITKLSGNIKSYAERLFSFIHIDSLQPDSSRLALIEPAKKFNVIYTEEAVQKIIELTEGYPYFLQEFGKQVWPFMDNNIINADSVVRARPLFEKILDDSFFKVRYDRTTPKEREFMVAMVNCGKLPCTISQVAINMKTNVPSISPIRAQLINKGLIYSTGHGEIDFTVPQFKQFLIRTHNL